MIGVGAHIHPRLLTNANATIYYSQLQDSEVARICNHLSRVGNLANPLSTLKRRLGVGSGDAVAARTLDVADAGRGR
jgi:hypothetical protein